MLALAPRRRPTSLVAWLRGARLVAMGLGSRHSRSERDWLTMSMADDGLQSGAARATEGLNETGSARSWRHSRQGGHQPVSFTQSVARLVRRPYSARSRVRQAVANR